jgi:hypothetical protein
MKNSIKLTALFLLAGASVFAAVPAKAVVHSSPAIITFSSLPSQNGIDVKVEKSEKAIVIISDKDGNVLRKDVLSNKKNMEKGYILTSLDNGDYTIEVISNGKSVKEDVHVYDEDQTKMFIVKQ